MGNVVLYLFFFFENLAIDMWKRLLTSILSTPHPIRFRFIHSVDWASTMTLCVTTRTFVNGVLELNHTRKPQLAPKIHFSGAPPRKNPNSWTKQVVCSLASKA